MRNHHFGRKYLLNLCIDYGYIKHKFMSNEKNIIILNLELDVQNMFL